MWKLTGRLSELSTVDVLLRFHLDLPRHSSKPLLRNINFQPIQQWHCCCCWNFFWQWVPTFPKGNNSGMWSWNTNTNTDKGNKMQLMGKYLISLYSSTEGSLPAIFSCLFFGLSDILIICETRFLLLSQIPISLNDLFYIYANSPSSALGLLFVEKSSFLKWEFVAHETNPHCCFSAPTGHTGEKTLEI